MNNYRALKSGTDIRGRAIASEGKEAVLTSKAVGDFAKAFALWLTARTGKQKCRIAIGRDSRLTGEGFAQDIAAALKNSGQELFDCGLFSTPAAYLVTKFPSVAADGSIMITASHHPKDINGLKFFTAEGGVNKDELDEIITLAENGEEISNGGYTTVVKRDCLRLYSDMLTDVIRKGTGLFQPLKGLKIVVDAGHGAGGFFASRVLDPLGADTSCSQFLEPDGNFPAHAPNPENAEAINSLKQRVLETEADLGIIFDADVDRCAVVSHNGLEINRCALIALASAIVLPEHKGATIVTDSVTTEGLRNFIRSLGGVQLRFNRGYRNVIDEAKRLNQEGTDAPLAIETSGHAAFCDHYFLDDGAYFVAKILVKFSELRRNGKDLTDLISGFELPLEEADVRLDFTCENFLPLGEKIINRLAEFSTRSLDISADSAEGVRAYVRYADGYFIVRMSVHDPVLPIYMESEKRGGVLSIAKLLLSFLSGFSGLDCAPLKSFIERKQTELDEEADEQAFIADSDNAFTKGDDEASATSDVANLQEDTADVRDEF